MTSTGALRVLALWLVNRDGYTRATAGDCPSAGDVGEKRRTAVNLAGGYAGIIPGDLMVLGR